MNENALDGSPVAGIPDDFQPGPEIEFQAAAEYWHRPEEVWGPIRDITKPFYETGDFVMCSFDTGYSNHPLKPDPLAAESFISGEGAEDRGNGHGPHTQGTMCGTGGIGIAEGCQFISAKVLSDRNGSGSSQGIANATKWAREWCLSRRKYGVCNYSLGSSRAYRPLQEQVDADNAVGRPSIWAAGNSGFGGSRNTIGYEARYGGASCTGATKENGGIANFSSSGPQMDIAVPGQNIVSTVLNNRLAKFNGTSMACPFHAAFVMDMIVCNMASGGPTRVDIADLRGLYRRKEYMWDKGDPGYDVSYGNGTPHYLKIVRAMADKKLRFN